MRRLAFIALGLAAGTTVAMWGVRGGPDQPGRPAAPAHVRGQVERQGLARVIVELDVLNGDRPEPSLAAAAAADRRRDITAAQARVIARIGRPGTSRDPSLRTRLHTSPSKSQRRGARPGSKSAGPGTSRGSSKTHSYFRAWSESVPIVQGDQAWLANLDGQAKPSRSSTVASTHPIRF